MSDLSIKHCVPCEGGVPVLEPDAIQQHLSNMPKWSLSEDSAEISRALSFKDFHETMAFVNALAWMAHQEGHHPDVHLGYDYVRIHYSTHAVGGLTENDFICAAKVEKILSA